MAHVPAHKHVGDAGKPGQIVYPIPPGLIVNPVTPQDARDLMDKPGISPPATGHKSASTQATPA